YHKLNPRPAFLLPRFNLSNLRIHPAPSTSPIPQRNIPHRSSQISRIGECMWSVEDSAIRRFEHELQWNLLIILLRDIIRNINAENLEIRNEPKWQIRSYRPGAVVLKVLIRCVGTYSSICCGWAGRACPSRCK